jgi:hypothetical protein
MKKIKLEISKFENDNKDFGPVSDFKSDSNVLIATDNGIYMINGRSVVAQKGQLLAYRCPLTNRWELYEN